MERGIDYFMKRKKIGLSILLFSIIVLTGVSIVPTNANASSTTTPAITDINDASTSDAASGVIDGSPAAWAELPESTVAILKSPNDYTTYDDHGKEASTVPGYGSQIVTRVAVNLDTNNTECFFLQLKSKPGEWIKLDSTVTVYIGPDMNDLLTTKGGDTPTNFVVNFVDQNNKTIQKQLVLPISSVKDDVTSYMNPELAKVMTNLRDALTQVTYDIDGYTLRATDSVTTDGDYTATFHYVKKSTPVTPSGNANPVTDMSSSSSESSSDVNQPTPRPASVKSVAVYATEAIGLYKTPNFTKNSRQYLYTKQSRTERPKFVVIGYARSKNGTLRYKVRDVRNPQREGYITANSRYVTNTYYQTKPKAIRVLSRQGINAYGQVSLSGKSLKHYAQGASLKVKAIKSYHLTSRFVLSDGHYISANKVLVIKK